MASPTGDRATMTSAKAVVLRRLSALGYPPIRIDVSGRGLTVRWSRSDVPDTIVSALTQRAALEFRPVLQVTPGPVCTATLPPVAPDQSAQLPQTAPNHTVTACLSLAPSALTSPTLADARAEPGAGQGWEVRVTFSGDSGGRFDQIAQQYYRHQLAIVIDDQVISAPTVNATRFNGTAIISGAAAQGGFTRRQAQDLAAALISGPLPVGLIAGSVTH